MFHLALQLAFYLLVPKRSHSKNRNRIVANELFKLSFRIGGIQNGLTFLVSQAARCFYWPIALKSIEVEVCNESPILVFDGVIQSKLQRENFLNFYGDIEKRKYVFRDDLLGFISFSDRVLYLLCSFILIPLTVISRNGSFLGRVFSLRLLLEVRALQIIAIKSSCKKVYMFNIFEPDANWIAKILMNQGIQVVKIPSEVPLKFHNEYLICSELVICNEYQREELERFTETQEIGVVSEIWGPESSAKVFDRYREIEFHPQTRVGFYSSGGWLRAKLSHWEGEQKKMLEEHSIWEVVKVLRELGIDDFLVFLHPREKLHDHIESTKAYYTDLGVRMNIDIKLEETPSSDCFERIHLGLTTLSTIAYERIFFGFPTLILDKSTMDFPIPSSPFSNLYVKEPSLLQSEIKNALQQTRVEFYESRQLRHYQHPDILL
ncbi:MAG: hypothetical protein HQ500_10975 [Flavobacteriales bacterium]|nr:hypothetical protein [Flavobacteriales bacterium]